ncbi:hypothetical protein NDU88_003634 [Pleurodeles waltl]|uniref:Uncharacterized protein n=1 Tax=Pleurodeles waltl TaxID=8319 RepID=A0AAV7PDE2_PLEWA|nr:hypothetical protein NDU88_003634 [Pleurodeles waltl]
MGSGCDEAPEPALDEIYPVGTQEREDTNPEEAGTPEKQDHKEDPEVIGVLNHVQKEYRESLEEEENRRRTMNETDRGSVTAGPGKRLQGGEAPTAADTVNLKETSEKGDAEGPATFWEECDPFRYRL